jgi:hypothetical protein
MARGTGLLFKTTPGTTGKGVDELFLHIISQPSLDVETEQDDVEPVLTVARNYIISASVTTRRIPDASITKPPETANCRLLVFPADQAYLACVGSLRQLVQRRMHQPFPCWV